MQSSNLAVASFRPTARAAISNGSRILLNGCDGRSTKARRFRDLMMCFSDELGGAEGLTTGQQAMVKQAAAAVLRAEELQEAIVRGDAVDDEQVVRVGNLVNRTLALLGIKPKARPSGPDLKTYLANKVSAG